MAASAWATDRVRTTHRRINEETTAMSRDDVLAKVREVAVTVLAVDPGIVTESATFKDDLGADSLDVGEPVMALEESLDITIPEEDLEGVETVGQAIDVVIGKLAAV